jgi:two-component system NarL family sensor kinase
LRIHDSFPFDESSYNVFLSAGVIYKNRNRYNEALELLIIAYDGFQKTKNTVKLIRTLNVIASIQKRLREYKTASIYYKKALELTDDNSNAKAALFNNLAICYKNLNIQDSVLYYYNKSLDFAQKSGSNYGKILCNLAIAHTTNGNYNIAEKKFTEAIFWNKKEADTTSLLYSFNGIMELFIKKNELTTAKLYLDSIKVHLPKVKDQSVFLDYLKHSSAFYEKNNDYKTALDFHKEYTDLFEKNYDKELAAIVLDLQSKFEYNESQRKIKKLSLSNFRNLEEIDNKNQKIESRNRLIIILCGVLLSFIGAYYIFIQKQKVRAQRAQIDKLESIFKGQEVIQKRIARDLHDIITSNFDGIRLKIIAVRASDNPDAILQTIIDELKHINDQIRMVSHRLMPLDSYLRGNNSFTEIIKARLSEFQLFHKIYVNLKQAIPEVLNTFKVEAQNNFYGITLEILSNVSKHSHATELQITNYLDNKNQLHFVFSDNGLGIQTQKKEGIGILSMRQRTQALNGTIEIEKIDSGTWIHLQIPLKMNQ